MLEIPFGVIHVAFVIDVEQRSVLHDEVGGEIIDVQACRVKPGAHGPNLVVVVGDHLISEDQLIDAGINNPVIKVRFSSKDTTNKFAKLIRFFVCHNMPRTVCLLCTIKMKYKEKNY